jgi:hypothetical protein
MAAPFFFGGRTLCAPVMPAMPVTALRGRRGASKLIWFQTI